MENRLKYQNLSLIDLVKEIVKNSDHYALEEFHTNRILFNYKGKTNPLVFSDYLEELRKSILEKGWLGSSVFEVASEAYNLTMDKFYNLPFRGKRMKHDGADCRLYFKAFLKRVEEFFRNRKPATQLEEELRAAKIMQGLVRRHFILSRLEAERNSNPFWSRYIRVAAQGLH